MGIEVFNRYEHKYLLERKTFEKVLKVLDEHMELDSHNVEYKPYTIANIYFDTDDNFLIKTSLSRPVYKEKLRARSYSLVGANSEVYLEIKKKYKGKVNKRRTKLTLSEVFEFIETSKEPEIKSYMNPQVLHEIAYFLKVYKVKPKVYIEYDRIAYFERNNPDLRISFDFNIRTRRKDLRFEEKDCEKQILANDVYLMEIKTSLAKPLWLTNMLNELEIKRCRFSKYGVEYTQYLKELNEKYIDDERDNNERII